jgi:hypothetical protein
MLLARLLPLSLSHLLLTSRSGLGAFGTQTKGSSFLATQDW